MQGEKQRRLPQFTITKLFLLTSAIAIGVAASQIRSVEEPNPWPSIYNIDTPFSQAPLYCGVVLIVYELIRQAIFILRHL